MRADLESHLCQVSLPLPEAPLSVCTPTQWQSAPKNLPEFTFLVQTEALDLVSVAHEDSLKNQEKPDRFVAFCRRVLPYRVKETIRDYLASPAVSKYELADAVAIGVFAGYSPLPVMPLVVAAGLARLANRNTYVATLSTLYQNVFTIAPMIYLQYKVGDIFVTDSPLLSFCLGTAILAVVTPVLARQGTILLHPWLHEPTKNFMKKLVA